MSLTFGDFIQNLRASLDHSIYALADPKPDRGEYPIKTQESQYTGPIDPRNPLSRSHRDIDLEGIADEYRAIVDATQPYLRGNVKAASKDPLALLAWLSNTDKHRLVHSAFHRQAGPPRVTVTRGHIGDIRIRSIPLDQPVTNGTEVYRWKCKTERAETEVDVEVFVGFTVAFSERACDYVELEDLWHYVYRPIAGLQAISEGRTASLDTSWPPTSRKPWAPGYQGRRRS